MTSLSTKRLKRLGYGKNDGFTATSYYPIYLEEAYKELETKKKMLKHSETETDNAEEGSEESLNVAGIYGLIGALEAGAAYSEALEQYANSSQMTMRKPIVKYGSTMVMHSVKLEI